MDEPIGIIGAGRLGQRWPARRGCLIFVAGDSVAGLVLPRGGLIELTNEEQAEKVDPEIEKQPRSDVNRVRIGCR